MMKQKTETTLCTAFMELLRKYPFPKITIQKIAEKSDVNRQTFYYHFDNIYDLLARTLEYALVTEGKVFESGDWDTSLYQILLWLKQNQQMVKNVTANVELRYVRMSFYPMIERCFAQLDIANTTFGRNRKESGRNEEMETFIRRFLTMGVGQYILDWIENDMKEKPDKMIAEFRLVIGLEKTE